MCYDGHAAKHTSTKSYELAIFFSNCSLSESISNLKVHQHWRSVMPWDDHFDLWNISRSFLLFLHSERLKSIRLFSFLAINWRALEDFFVVWPKAVQKESLIFSVCEKSSVVIEKGVEFGVHMCCSFFVSFFEEKTLFFQETERQKNVLSISWRSHFNWVLSIYS